MGTLFSGQVRPGEIISSALVNQLMREIEALDSRVSTLEQTPGSSMAITSIQPAGPVRIGQEVRVLGRNFGFTTGTMAATLDNFPIPAFKTGSNDQLLIFDVPDIGNLPNTGKVVLLSLAAGGAGVQRPITVLPASDALSGGADVVLTGIEPNEIAPNALATFKFRLTSRANLSANFTIDPVISKVANTAVWQANVKVVDQNGAPIASRVVPLAAGEEKLIGVAIDPVPDVAVGTTFALTVDARADNIGGSSGLINSAVGPAIQPDNTIKLSFDGAGVIPPTDGEVTPSTISLKSGASSIVTLLATFSVAGTYAVTARIVEPNAKWIAQRQQSTPASYVITAADLNNPEAVANRLPRFVVRPEAGALAAGTVQFRIQRQGATTLREFQMSVALRP